MSRRKAVVVCPGRGTYNKEELGYLARHHGGAARVVEPLERIRRERGQEGVADLDGRERFDSRVHTRGENAAALIHACAYADFLAIDRERYDLVAVTGNSMGWYIALACSGALGPADAAETVNTMGTWMQESMVGGQLVYPVVDEDWRPVPGRRARLLALVEEIGAGPGQRLYLSIDLGGMLVFAGEESALQALAARLEPEQQRYPMRLPNHAAFHCALQRPISERASSHFDAARFTRPAMALIDGRGHLWSRFGTDPEALHDYTFGHQVCETYDFARAVRVAVREFAPDALIVLGPGSTLGGAIAQTLIDVGWQGLGSRAEFVARQAEAPFVLSMGRVQQRSQVVGAGADEDWRRGAG